MRSLHLAQAEAADELLSRDPLALLLGMLLDQQFPMERAFASPYVLSQRLGRDLDAQDLANYDENALAAIFAGPPALHRYPAAMAARVQSVCRHIVKQYGGKPELLWQDVSTGHELLRRVQKLPGFGSQKARIFVALLGKQYGVQPSGWREASKPYGDDGSRRSIADVVDAVSLAEVRAFKKEMKAKGAVAPTPNAS